MQLFFAFEADLFSKFILLIIIAYFILWIFSKWFQEDEYRSDIFGAKILVEYGRKKEKKIHISESLEELFDIILAKNKKNYEIINRLFPFHPPLNRRIEKIKEFERFYYS